jgi:CRP-like cAMP-binding protein
MKPAENVFGWKQLAEDAKKKIQDAQDKRREIRNDFYEEARGFYEETRGFTKLVFAKPLELINQQFEPPQPGEARRLNSADKAFVKSIITVQKDFVMSNLSDKEVDMLVHAMEKIIVTPGENVITQGDVGDYLYVLNEGSIRFIKDGKEVGIAGPGEVFGELALLYDCRRAATVVADGECLLFRVCRSTFRTIQANFILYNDDEARRLLKQSKAFQDLPDDIIREMASYLFKKEFKKGEILSRKGEDFGKVYFIREGRALASGITVNNTDYADIELKPGECFGERAILMGGGALANVECLTDGLLYVLTKERFLHCLEGIDLHEILEKKIDASVLVSLLGGLIRFT